MYLAVGVGTVVSDRFKDFFGPTVAIEYVQSMVSGDQSDPMLGQRASTVQDLVACPKTKDEEPIGDEAIRQRAMLDANIQALVTRYR